MKNKLKDEMEKIKMSDKTKERIIAACEEAAKNRSIEKTNNSEYTDHVFKAERVKPRNRIMRSISAVAACALIAGGIGTTGVLLHKQGNVPSTESETTTVAAIEDISNVGPFGDFSEFDYRFDAGDGKYGRYSAETYAKLSDFLNKFNWGEPVEKPKNRDNSADVEGQIYDIKWTRGDTPPIECNIHIANDGYVFYQESMMDFETGGQMPLNENNKWYKVDFDAFDKGMKEILKDELATEETTVESPFTDIIKTAYLVDAFDASAREVTDEKIEALIKTYNSQTWTECDCADKFVDFDFAKLSRDYFVVVGSETIGTNEYLMTTYDGYACVYTEIITDDGNKEKSEKKCYKCDDTEFGEKLLDVYDPIESDNVEPGTQDMTDYNNIVALLNGNDCGGLVVWCDENGGWRKQDFDQNQYDTVKNYFNEHEVKEMVPNVYGVIEAKRWNDVFGLSQIQLYDKVKKEHTILYISKDSSMIAISRPSENPYGDTTSEDPYGYTIKIYKAEGLEVLQFIRYFAE